jgi:hypothetical protein
MAPNRLATDELKWVFATVVRHFYITTVHFPFIILFFPSSLSLSFNLSATISLFSFFFFFFFFCFFCCFFFRSVMVMATVSLSSLSSSSSASFAASSSSLDQ